MITESHTCPHELGEELGSWFERKPGKEGEMNLGGRQGLPSHHGCGYLGQGQSTDNRTSELSAVLCTGLALVVVQGMCQPRNLARSDLQRLSAFRLYKAKLLFDPNLQ